MRLVCFALIWLMALPCGNAAAAREAVMAPAYAPMLQRLTDEDGLPLNSLTALLQARDGYLWVASVGGLARFDGLDFTHIPTLTRPPTLVGPATEISGLPSIRILALMEDARGRIWIGTQDNGISLYDHGRILQLDACAASCQVAEFITHDGHVYVATNIGLLRIDPDTLHTETLLAGQNMAISSLAFDAQGRGFIVANGALATLDENEPWLHDMPAGVTMPSRLLADEHGFFMAAVSGLYHFASATGTWTFHDIGATRYLFQAPDGSLLVSTRHDKIQRLRPDGDWELLADLAPLIPYKMTQDSEGNLWIGTQGQGLLRLRGAWIGTLADPAFDMKYPGRAIASDGSGGLWFALACEYLRHWRADGRVQRPPESEDLQDRCTETLLRGRDGSLWMGTAHGKLKRLRPDTATVESVVHWPGHQPVRAMLELPDGRLLVSVRRDTYTLDFAADGHLSEEPVAIAALEGLIVRQIVPSRRQGIWFVGEFGALRLHAGEIVERWGPEQGLSGRFARALHEDADGTLWIGTYGAGLNRIADGRLTIYHPQNGLFDNTISCILEDRSGRLWMSGNRGITLVDPRSATPTSIQSRGFSGNDGLIPAETNGGYQGSCLIDDSGRFWFALVEGFAVLDPERPLPEPPTAPPARIERVTVSGHTHDPRLPLRLTASAQNIEIDYTAITLTTPKRLRFRFRLAGMDTDWTDAGTSRHVVYPSLPWGSYAFQVQARIEGTPWPETFAELQIMRPAPWYQRPWVWLVCTLLVLMLLLDTTWQRPLPEPASPP